MPLLEVEDLRTGYGALRVLHGITFSLEAGETGVMLGANGAGKSTTMMTVAGMLRTWAGRVVFDGRSLGRLDAASRVKLGIVLVPEGRRVFPALSVAVNLRLGNWSKRKEHGKQKELYDRVFEYFPRLAERRDQAAGTLSGGEQQMLAIGRALMADPRLLLIDEASLGLAPKTALELFDIARSISRTGVGVVMVEQNAGALKVADRAWIMQKGTIISEASGKALKKGLDLRAAYLG